MTGGDPTPIGRIAAHYLRDGWQIEPAGEDRCLVRGGERVLLRMAPATGRVDAASVADLAHAASAHRATRAILVVSGGAGAAAIDAADAVGVELLDASRIADARPSHHADPAGLFGAAIATDPRSRKARDLRRYGPPRTGTNRIYWLIVIAGALLFVLLIRGVLEKTRWTAVEAAALADSGRRGAPVFQCRHADPSGAPRGALPCTPC